MTLDFTVKNEVHVKRFSHVEDMINSCPIKIKADAAAPTPAGNSLFSVGKSKLLESDMKEKFHTCVAKGLFVAKRSRPDILPTISALTSRVRCPNHQDMEKLVRCCKYVNSTKEMFLKLKQKDLNVFKIYVDASYAVHEDSHIRV